MSVIKCPYDETTLKLALLGLDKKMEDEELTKKISIRLSESLPAYDKIELNKKIAQYNGISVLDLINSPNYDTLKQEYYQNIINKAIVILKEESFTDKEAWALITLSTGILKI